MAHQASQVRAASESNRLALTRIVRALGLALLMTQAVVAQSAPQSVPTWRDPSPHQVRWITVDSSVRLEVLDWGGSGRPIVWLGCYLSAHVHDEIAPKLTNQFHVYGVTRRGIGASAKPATGYTVQRSVNDVLEVLDALNLQKSLLVGTSCAGQILTMFAGQHSDRVYGLVYLDGATDPTLSPAEYDPPMPDPTTLPRSIKSPPASDNTSFEAFRIAQRRDQKVVFPEAELRQQFVENPDGSVGRSLLSPEIRRAITVDARVKPNYAGIRVPVLAIYQADRPFEEVAADFDIRNEQERAALRQQYAATRAMYMRWQHDLLAGVPTARIVELPGASLFMFLSNEADVLREIRAFAATLTSR
jgi:non-heme chloroperoxidase